MNDSTTSHADSGEGNALTVLLLGSGGREHALAWRISRSPSLRRLICAPGNPGMEACGDLRPLDILNPGEVVAAAQEWKADLVVVGPEAPLAAGVADALHDAGIPVFGPSKGASRLEWDKAFAKEFMQRHGIPTASSRTFAASELEEAREYVAHHPVPVVLKAAGLAAGKGVVIAETSEKAVEELEQMLAGDAFGDAGRTVVVEEFMQGEEASIFALCDGDEYRLLSSSQDHKRVGEGDTGPNTGGMGAYAPAPVVSEDVLSQVCRQVIEPTLQGMKEAGTPYVGCLYVGLMIHEGHVRIVEFNSRLGDPEAQVVLPLVKGDFLQILYAAATGTLKSTGPIETAGSAVCVVMASGGYPGSYPKGLEITGVDAAEAPGGVVVFHAGTARADGVLRTAGGRVLGVTAISESGNLQESVAAAYEAVEQIAFEGAFYRRDIAARALSVGERTE